VDHQNLEQVTGGLRTDAAERETPPRGIAGKIRSLVAGNAWILAAVLLQLALTLAMWAGAVMAGLRLLAARRSPVAVFQVGLLVLTAAVGLAAGALPNAQVRFRLTLLPALLPLMAAGFAWLDAARRRRASGPVGIRRAR
jgi:hypothetical protein